MDEVELLLHHALTGRQGGGSLCQIPGKKFRRAYVLMNILLRRGTIAEVQPYDQVMAFPHVDMYIPMLKTGTEIKPDGSMVQRFGKVALSADSREELLDAMRYFQTHLQILDENHENMVIPSMGSNYR